MRSAYEAFQDGSRLLASDDHHAAVIALEEARALEPDQASVREALGRAYFRSSRFADAEAEFARVVELDPVNDYAHFGLGLALARQGEAAAARGHLKLATVMRPEAVHYQRALASITPSDDA